MAESRKPTPSKQKPQVREPATKQAHLLLAAIVGSSDDAIVSKDLKGIITSWNSGAERLYGYSAEEMIGKHISLLMPSDCADDCANIMRRIRSGEVIKHFETQRQKKDGTRVEVSLAVAPIVDPEGRIIGASAIARDIGERKRTEMALRESEELLRMATQAGKMLAYEWDVASDKVVRTGGVTEMLGEDEGPYTTGQQILSMIPSEDRDRLTGAIAQLTPEKPDLRIRYRMVRSDGRVIFVDRSSRADFDEHGKMVRIMGMLADVTDHVKAQEALFEKDRELSETQRVTGAGSWSWDAPSDVVTWSEELYRIAGLSPLSPAPLYKEHPRLLTTESWERLQAAVEKALQEGTTYELDLEMVRPDGSTRWVRDRGEAVSDATGRITQLRGTIQDITERKLAEENLAALSRKLLEAQDQERRRIARELHDNTNQRLALLAVGIERLKEAIPRQITGVRARVDEIHKQTLEISKDIQDLSHQLHTSKLEYLGLVSAMRGFCRDLGDKHKVVVTFASEGVPATLPPEISLCLFRIMQEGLHNALKHSGGKAFEVKLYGSAKDIRLIVRDSGVGFDPESAREGEGLGLVAMEERVKLVKGTISITSRTPSGTEIDVRVPLSAEMRSAKKSAGA